MRVIEYVIGAVFLGLLLTSSPSFHDPGSLSVPSVAAAADQTTDSFNDPARPKLAAPQQAGDAPATNVNINERHTFFANPIVIAAIAVGLLLIAFIAVAGRGGDTTIIREK